MIEKIPSKVSELKDKLFKKTSYDIRAYVGEVGSFFGPDAVLTPETMRAAGVLTGSLEFVNNNNEKICLMPGEYVVIGRDNGPTSEALANAFAEGLSSQGVNVYDIGVASSGQVYHNEAQLNAQGHVQITRSHVEVTTNGAKFSIKGQGVHTYLLEQMNIATGKKYYGRDSSVAEIFDRKIEGRKLYYDKMTVRYGEYFSKHPRKVGVNLFGGTGLQYKALYEKIFEGVHILGDTIDVNDGSLLADPTRREMLDKVPHLRETLAEGVRVHSFDLDADRGSVTEGEKALELGEQGHYMGDDLAYIIADYKLKVAVPRLINALAGRNISKENADEIVKLASMVYVDPRYSSGVQVYAEKLGGYTGYHPKGHSLWKETMSANMKKLASLAGFKSAADFVCTTGYQDMQIEASLHFFVTDPEDGIPRDDAVENVFILEKMFDELNISSLKEYFAHIPKRYATKEIRTNTLPDTKDDITAYIIKSIKDDFAGDSYEMVDFEGQLRVNWDSGFIMYGMSNTSPKLTFMAEGETPEERNEALSYVIALHNAAKAKYGDNLPMDLSENSFFAEDKSYNMQNPDSINFQDVRVQNFIKKHSLK